MSKVTFETELNDEALGALKSYLAKRNEQLDMRLSEQLEKLYAATVPAAVREYLGEKNGTPVRRSAARPRRAAPSAGCCFSKRMRKVFKKNEKSMLQFCNKNSKKKRAFTMG